MSPEQPAEAWIEVLPLAASEPGRVLRAPAGTQVRVGATAQRPVLVCLGGDGFPLHCRRHTDEVSVLPVRGPGVRVRGSVRQRTGEDEVGVAGAAVALFLDELPSRRPAPLPLRLDPAAGRLIRRVESGVDGSFALPPLAPGRYRLEVETPDGLLQLGEPLEVPPVEPERDGGAPPADATLQVPPFLFADGLSTGVQVTDGGGTPLAGARVTAHQGGAGGASVRTVSDDAGRAALHGLAPNRALTVACTASGFTASEHRFPAPPAFAECTLYGHAAVEGTATGDGEPLAGAVLTLTAQWRDVTGHRIVQRTRCGEDGRFAFTGLDAGGYTLAAAAPGHEPHTVDVELAPGETLRPPPLELLLAPRRSAVVRDAVTGAPVAGATVTAAEPAGAVETRSDGDGRFEFHQGEVPLVLRLNAAGYPPHTLRVPPPPEEADEPLLIDLPRGGRLRVTLWDETTDAPCAGCPVLVDRPRETDLPAPAPVLLTTGADGVARSDLLAPGAYRVTPERVRSLGSTVTVRSGDEQQRAEVRPDAVTEVHFGRRRGELEVVFRPLPPPRFALRADGPRGRITAERRADGAFALRRAAGEPLLLRLTAPGVSVFQTAVAADFDRPVLLLDLPRTRVSGRLAEGAAAGGRELRATAAGSSVGAWTVSAPDGGFVLPHLPPGHYRLSVDGTPLTGFVLGDGQELELGPLDPAE